MIKLRRLIRTMKAFDMVTVFRKDHSRDKENQYIAKALTILRKA